MKQDKERQIPYDIISMWNLKYDTNEHIYKTKEKKDSDTEDRLAVVKGEIGSSRLGF